MVRLDSVWVAGSSNTGKTTRLVEQFCLWMEADGEKSHQGSNRRQKPKELKIPSKLNPQQTSTVLVFAANNDNRQDLVERIVAATGGKYPIRAKTPLGFFQDEVILYWPLLIGLLNLKAQFPVRLRPETEQELATRLWKLSAEIISAAGVNEYRLVRRILDLLQLAAYSGTPTEEIGTVLAQGLEDEDVKIDYVQFLLNWRSWCWERGLLTYGIITELYYQHLLPDPNYQQHLLRRYRYVLADDVDDYPGVARHLFDFLLDRGVVGAFSYNPDGAIRLGLGSDPEYLVGLASRCKKIETLTTTPVKTLTEVAAMMTQSVSQPLTLVSVPSTVQTIATTSRAELLRETGEKVALALESGAVQPQEIAIIAPGLDAIARYSLVEILRKKGIAVAPTNDQRPLNSYPAIRGLLTLLTLIYPGLGRLVDRDAIAEMLVVLSPDLTIQNTYKIDPVRAGLIADACFEPHPDRPNLLPHSAYDRWDRLGYTATNAYEQLLEWIEKQRSQYELRLLPSPISLLDRAIQDFLWLGSNLPYDLVAALRELLETAQHYWEVDMRLRQIDAGDAPANATIAQFISLLRRGTITANPYPVRPIGAASRAITLATIFQYRSSRQCHRWQFWLDAGSPLWLSGGAATLFGANLFLQHRFARPWTAEEAKQADDERLQRIIRDLLGRVEERVYLCHSELAVNGQEQLGPLLNLVNASLPIVSEALTNPESLELTK
ncbi:hypothetical protein [Synechocystis sp. PCC 7509]|uniref:hypothetical protein n=1 Tax=Synechocystis sp. PCC 7509 TaxID=927677 RepID=UPI0002ACC46D|nr:hypothetical protein [Synechocystis sp. PCC 7509]